MRRGRYVACAAAALVAIGGAGAALALAQPPGKAPTNTAAKLCGLVACAAVPSGGTSTPARAMPSTALGPGAEQITRSASPTPSASTSSAATPGPRPTPSPSSSPLPVPVPTISPTPALPDVTVTFSTPRQWAGGFQGELTIDNQGDSAVSGWQITITLPGDQVRYVWNAEWQFDGDSLTLTPASDDQVIEPGASATVNFVAVGGTTEPASCTFDGSACS